MSQATVTLQGIYYDGQHPIGIRATLVWAEREAALIGEQISQRYALNKLFVSPRVGHADRFVSLPDGGQLQCPDHPILDRLPHEVGSEGIVAWLEQRLYAAVASIAIVIALVISAYVYGLPFLAAKVAAHIPLETERELGDRALVWLDKSKWFAPSALPADRQASLRDGFSRLCKGLPQEQYYRLEFRNSSFIGPNAFALPGGAIVITDPMVNLAKTQEEALAVLAHEIGHVELRHTMRHMLQDSITAAIAATVTADAASLSIAIAGLPAAIAQAKYSREFEAEADEFSFRLLKQHGQSPEAFASIMARLSKGTEQTERAMAFLSTHPVTEERVRRAREAAGHHANPKPSPP